MAYGNWGAFVYRDGERQPKREDATPYREEELEPGYWQAFRAMFPEERPSPKHAVLGKDRVRLCGYKNYPELFVDGKPVELAQYRTSGGEESDDGDYSGEIDGYRFRARKYNENMVDLWLAEPDGVQWTATCGYCYGAGWMD